MVADTSKAITSQMYDSDGSDVPEYFFIIKFNFSQVQI